MASALAQPLPAAPQGPETPLSTPPSHEEIAALAYHYWQAEGCQEGRDLENWLHAETDLTVEHLVIDHAEKPSDN